MSRYKKIFIDCLINYFIMNNKQIFGYIFLYFVVLDYLTTWLFINFTTLQEQIPLVKYLIGLGTLGWILFAVVKIITFYTFYYVYMYILNYIKNLKIKVPNIVTITFHAIPILFLGISIMVIMNNIGLMMLWWLYQL